MTIAGFGRFEMRPRKPKAYTNPKTKVSSRLESTAIPGFKASGRFKQKTAYEMESRDWSSDVCSSDLWTLGGDQPVIPRVTFIR